MFQYKKMDTLMDLEHEKAHLWLKERKTSHPLREFAADKYCWLRVLAHETIVSFVPQSRIVNMFSNQRSK
jgi:hypothetical protein